MTRYLILALPVVLVVVLVWRYRVNVSVPGRRVPLEAGPSSVQAGYESALDDWRISDAQHRRDAELYAADRAEWLRAMNEWRARAQ